MTPAQYNEYQRQADVIEEAKRWEKENQLKQMTAVKWFYEKLKTGKFTGKDTIDFLYETAKEMHKEEIMRAFIDGEENVWDRKNEGHGFQYDNHEHYYTEKFKK